MVDEPLGEEVDEGGAEVVDDEDDEADDGAALGEYGPETVSSGKSVEEAFQDTLLVMPLTMVRTLSGNRLGKSHVELVVLLHCCESSIYTNIKALDTYNVLIGIRRKRDA